MRSLSFTVSFIGTDGSGKSSVADAVDETLRTDGIPVIRQHWRPRVLGKRPAKAKFDPTSPHRYSPRSLIPSILATFFYWVDFLSGELNDKWGRDGELSVRLRERPFIDMAFDLKRYRLKGVGQLIQILDSLLPEPDLIVWLRGDSKVIFERKAELPELEIRRQQALAKRVLRRRKNLFPQDVGNKTVAEISKTVIAEIRSGLGRK